MLSSFRKYIFGGSLFLILSLSSCEYDSHATAYYDVAEPTDSVTASITFPGYSLKDTITLTAKDSIAYLLTVSGGDLDSANFQLNSISLSTTNDSYIQIDTLLTSGTTYPLTFSLHVSSGTGSLADIMQVEGVNYDDSTLMYVKFVY